jgi:erythromycin esterase-like protein
MSVAWWLAGMALADPSPASKWAEEHAIRLTGTDPRAPLDDLAPLDGIIGDAHLVALGEGTFGTHELFRAKQRILEYLVEKHGFSVLAIEASMPACEAVNRYVVSGEGRPEAALHGLRSARWDTDASLDLVRWMRAYNASGRGRIELVGFAPGEAVDGLEQVQAFADRVDPELATHVAPVRLRDSREAGVVSRALPIATVAGHRLEISADIRIAGIDPTGWAGLWFRVDGPPGAPALANEDMSERGISGTRGWQNYHVAVDVPAEATAFQFGALQVGWGEAWVDDLEVELDGRPIQLEDFEGTDLLLPFAGNTAETEHGEQPEQAWKPGGTARTVEVAPCDRGGRCLHLAAPVWAGGAADLVETLEANGWRYAAWASHAEVEHAIEMAHVASQAEIEATSWYTDRRTALAMQDRHMAENVMWLRDQRPPDARMVVWGHDDHVAKAKDAMGMYLDMRYHEDFLALAFSAGSGDFLALKDGYPEDNPLTPAPAGSVEEVLHGTGIPALIVDLRPATDTDPWGGWMSMRSIHGWTTDRGFVDRPLRAHFDGLVYVDATTATMPLEPHPKTAEPPQSE